MNRGRRLSTKVEVRRRPDYNHGLRLKRPNHGRSETEAGVTLPLTFKKEGVVERHQIEGTDPSDRYFNRSVLVSRVAQGYAGKVTYEALTVDGDTQPTIGAAVKNLVEKLHAFGFRGIRTRPNFKGRRYLAEKETWLDYADA